MREEGPAPVFTKSCHALGTKDASVRRLSFGGHGCWDWSKFRERAVQEGPSEMVTQELRP